MPCGGSGRLISNLGGSPKDIACPWCAGTGTRQAGIDAQAAWRERAEAENAAAEPGRAEGEDPAAEPDPEEAAAGAPSEPSGAPGEAPAA